METEKDYNDEAEWIKQKEERCKGLEQQEWDEIKVDVKEALRKAQKWKSPGIAKIPNFWLNNFDSIHENMTSCFNKAITNPEINPQWFTQGVTYLLPKSNDAKIHKNLTYHTLINHVKNSNINS